MASTGMRLGALSGLKLGDLKKIEEFGLYLIWVYNNSKIDTIPFALQNVL